MHKNPCNVWSNISTFHTSKFASERLHLLKIHNYCAYRIGMHNSDDM